MTKEHLETLPEASVPTELLLAQIAKGDKQSEQELISRHWRGLHYVLCRRTKDPDLAADLTQDAFLIAIDKARNSGIEKPAAFPAFIRQVGINLMLAHYRKEKRRSTDLQPEIDLYIPDDSPSIYQQLQMKSILNIVEQLMDELTVERDRTILKHYFVYDKEKLEICEELGLGADHFDRVLQRARARLKKLVVLKLGSESAKKLSSALFDTTLLVLLAIASQFFVENKSFFSDAAMRELYNQRHLSLCVSGKSMPLMEIGVEIELGENSLEYYCYG